MVFNAPAKVLKGSATVSTAVDTINDPTSTWNGNPKSWNINLKIQPQNMSWPGPRKDYVYDGRDINVGDWVADGSGCRLQITSITAATPTSATVVAEDIDLKNTYADSSGEGDGSIENGFCLVFEDRDAIGTVFEILQYLAMIY